MPLLGGDENFEDEADLEKVDHWKTVPGGYVLL
jgi:hypothetical protein